MNDNSLFDDVSTRSTTAAERLPEHLTREELECALLDATWNAKYYRARTEAFERVADKSSWAALALQVIAMIKDLPDNCRQSGDDSHYLDVWEEYCSQIQGQHFVMFELYESTIEAFCEAELDALTPTSRMSLWVTSEGFGQLDFEDDGESIFCPQVDLMVRDLHNWVRWEAANVELETLNERLLAIAPWRDTCIRFMDDPGYLLSVVFEESSSYVFADPKTFRQLAREIAQDTLMVMEDGGVARFEFGDNLEEQLAYLAEELERFFHSWRAIAKEKFGARLQL